MRKESRGLIVTIGLLLILYVFFIQTVDASDGEDFYPYAGEKFGILLDDSYSIYKNANQGEFYTWMNQVYENYQYHFPGKENLSLAKFLTEVRTDLQNTSNLTIRTNKELEISVWLHKFIKTVIPKFSLARGFEFFNVVRYGERQCLLQSILLVSLLQEININAGIVMIYKNPEGIESNNGHVAVLIKLSNTKDVLLDASRKEPFVNHMGIFAKNSANYIYLKPIFEPNTYTIDSYHLTSGSGTLNTSQVKQLDFNFVRSQNFFYRGEHAKGGLIEGPKNKEGLLIAANYLEKSVQLCPNNPLAIYILSRIYRELGQTNKAMELHSKANKLYVQFGWSPRP